jgi:hypothetical protein
MSLFGWPTPPLRGQGLGARRRIGRLMMSEERIADPDDARLVRAQVEYARYFYEARGQRLLRLVQPWAALPLVGVALILQNWGFAVMWSVVGLLNVWLWSKGNANRGKMERTAQANGWVSEAP